MGSLWWFHEHFDGDQTETCLALEGPAIVGVPIWVLDSGYLQVKNHDVYDSEKYWEITLW